jgi:hypothetical protein
LSVVTEAAASDLLVRRNTCDPSTVSVWADERRLVDGPSDYPPSCCRLAAVTLRLVGAAG